VFDKKPSDIAALNDPAAARSGESANIRFKMNIGIAGHVATTGQSLAIADAYQDDRFNKDIDLKTGRLERARRTHDGYDVSLTLLWCYWFLLRTGFRTKSILCMPIFNSAKKVIGVVQLINKIGGLFTPRDQGLFAAFGVYCGLGLQATQLYEDLKRNEQRHRVCAACFEKEELGGFFLVFFTLTNRARVDCAERAVVPCVCHGRGRAALYAARGAAGERTARGPAGF
jgi:hypothetical protein